MRCYIFYTLFYRVFIHTDNTGQIIFGYIIYIIFVTYVQKFNVVKLYILFLVSLAPHKMTAKSGDFIKLPPASTALQHGLILYHSDSRSENH